MTSTINNYVLKHSFKNFFIGKKGHIFGYVKSRTTEGYTGIRSLEFGARLLGLKYQLSHLLGTRSLERCQEYIKHYINTF